MCDSPPVPTNGVVRITGNDIDSIATYSCDVGSELQGNDIAICTVIESEPDVKSAAFLPTAPTCIRKLRAGLLRGTA